MKSIRTLVSLLVLIVFAISVGWAAPPAVSTTTKKAERKATVEKSKAKTETGTTHVKGYTTKSGKVVKGYERKTTAKVKEPTKVTKPTEKMAKPTTKATKAEKAKAKTVSKGSKGGMGPGAGMVHVKGYCKKNGVCVKDYWRHAPTKK